MNITVKTSLLLGAGAMLIVVAVGIGSSRQAKPAVPTLAKAKMVAPRAIVAAPLDFSKLPMSAELPLVERPLQPGDLAPDFKLFDQNGKFHLLSDRRGKTTVLSFYPQDSYASCTQSAASLSQKTDVFKQRDVEVFGISVQPMASKRAFASRFDLNLPLLADPDKTATRDYGVLSQSGLSGRVTFVIGPDGRIQSTDQDVHAATHAQDVLARLDFLEKRRAF